MHKIKYSRGATRKLESIQRYIAETLKSPKAAATVTSSIIENISLLKENPEIGPTLSSRVDRVPDRFSQIRFLVCGKHVAIYEVEKTQIRVLAIYHTSEDIFGRVIWDLEDE